MVFMGVSFIAPGRALPQGSSGGIRVVACLWEWPIGHDLGRKVSVVNRARQGAPTGGAEALVWESSVASPLLWEWPIGHDAKG